MKCVRARELFSSHYEGHLTRGVSEALKAHLAECYDCQEEYRAFAAVFASLGELPPVEPPADLSERIARRLDEVIWEQNRSAKPTFGFLRWALAAATAAAIISLSILGYNSWQGAGVQAGPIAIAPAKPSAYVQVEEGSVRLSYTPSKSTYVTVTDTSNGKLLSRVDLKPGQPMSAPILVQSDESRVIKVRVDGAAEFLVVLPGRLPGQQIGKFDGRLLDALRLLSDNFGCVIEAHIPQAVAELAVSVDFTGLRLSQSLDSLLAGTGYKPAYQNGVVRIGAN